MIAWAEVVVGVYWRAFGLGLGEIGEFIVGESECLGLSSCGVVVAVVGAEVGSIVMMFRMSTVWLGGSGGAGVLKMAGVTVTVCAGTVVYAEMVASFAFAMHKTLGSATIDVAASSGTEGFLSSESGKAHSHFTWKCKTRVDHEVVIDGTRFLYQASAAKPDQQFR